MKKFTNWRHTKISAIKGVPSLLKITIRMFRDFMTLASPKTLAIRPENKDTLISKDDQVSYRSGAGKLPYLVKHSRPDIAKAKWESSKVADASNQANFKH